MQVVIDSRDALKDVLRVVGGLYGVALSVDAPTPAATSPKPATRVTAGRRRTPAATPARARKSAATARPDLAAVRSWARNNGFDVSDRGRVSNAVLDAYRKGARSR